MHSGLQAQLTDPIFPVVDFRGEKGLWTRLVRMRNIMCARGRNDARLIIPAMYTAARVPLLTPNCRPQLLNQISTPLSQALVHGRRKERGRSIYTLSAHAQVYIYLE